MLELRDYQREDVLKLSQFNATACFNEQRTGKTPTALKTLEAKGIEKFIAVCPTSATHQWQSEIEDWLNVPAIVVAGTPHFRNNLIQDWITGALIIGYEGLKTKGTADLILKQHPKGIILDEAHRIKNPKSLNTQAVFKFIHTPFRLALTGTPAPNFAHEIFSILHFLYPTTFTSYWKFIDEFFYKTKKHLGLHTYIEIGGFKPGKQIQLQNFLNRYTTQRKRSEVMPWLPKIEPPIKVRLPLTSEQKRYLDELEAHFETEDVVTQGVLDRLIRYRQICLHPGLLDLKGKSPKLEWILQYLQDYPDTPTIIFSKFTSFLKLLSKELPEGSYGMIIGETPSKTRNDIRIDFQTKAIKTILLNIDAGKEALTLDTAEAMIFTDKYPPIGDIQQAEARFIATTEAKANKPHVIYELMMKHSYDEHLYNLLKKRASEVDVINDYKKYLRRPHND